MEFAVEAVTGGIIGEGFVTLHGIDAAGPPDLFLALDAEAEATAVGFLVLLMQGLVSSSTWSIGFRSSPVAARNSLICRSRSTVGSRMTSTA